MATMRPLFVAFFSRSKLFGSTTRGNTNNAYPRNASRLGYFRKRENTEVEELDLHSDLGKSIRVTTTITNTESTRVGRNRDIGTDTNESEMALQGETKWIADAETDSVKDLRHTRTVIEAGIAV
jgi:hypothetical protein